MNSKVKKWFILGGIGLFSVTLAIAYAQYKRLMDYTIKFKNIKLKSITPEKINFDLFIDFKNNSSLKFDILEQEYSIYANNKFISKIINKSANTINANSTSVIGINVNINVKDLTNALNKNWASLLIKPDETKT
jgi:LEA14-like dessication related protein